ncbi:hypothetical protein [Sphaerisporangium fuscum]|uniref:hypothetical protein n=1 Tax=Sphaerisporangium fuscum TaxID=2835868 RepID=UPI001BDCCFDA|nr:hypothetical protein [Sphaerisporangium fuscum]
MVNVEVFLERDGRRLLIRRGSGEAHAAGLLAGVGGKAETDGAGIDVLEETARREVAGFAWLTAAEAETDVNCPP